VSAATITKLLPAFAFLLLAFPVHAQSNLYSNGSGNVGIGTNNPNTGMALDLSQNTNSFGLPVGTTGQRPTGVNGMLRYNSTTPGVEAFYGGTWKTLASTISSGGINTVIIQKFTASGTYTPSSGMLYCDIRLVGGGGGGGGASAQASGGGGGGAGAFSEAVFSSGTVGASQTVTIGAGGTAGSAGGNGGSGGTTSVGTLITAAGGGGGTGSTNNAVAATGGVGGNSGTALVSAGGAGNFGVGVNIPSTIEFGAGGTGGSSYFGGGGPGGAQEANGSDGVAPGSGGGGAASEGTGKTGGAGAAGYVQITEYCSQ
jgi:hypothetical protein